MKITYANKPIKLDIFTYILNFGAVIHVMTLIYLNIVHAWNSISIWFFFLSQSGCFLRSRYDQIIHDIRDNTSNDYEKTPQTIEQIEQHLCFICFLTLEFICLLSPMVADSSHVIEGAGGIKIV